MQKPHPNKVRTWSVNRTRIKRLVVRNWRITKIHTTRVMKGFERENKMLPNMLRKQQNAEQKKSITPTTAWVFYRITLLR